MAKYKVTIVNPSDAEKDPYNILVQAYNLAQKRTVLSDYLNPGDKRTYYVHEFVEMRVGRVCSN